jgi:hypothetical protein
MANSWDNDTSGYAPMKINTISVGDTIIWEKEEEHEYKLFKLRDKKHGVKL